RPVRRGRKANLVRSGPKVRRARWENKVPQVPPGPTALPGHQGLGVPLVPKVPRVTQVPKVKEESLANKVSRVLLVPQVPLDRRVNKGLLVRSVRRGPK